MDEIGKYMLKQADETILAVMLGEEDEIGPIYLAACAYRSAYKQLLKSSNQAAKTDGYREGSTE